MNVAYRDFSPSFWKLNKFITNASISQERLYAPNLYGATFWNLRSIMVNKSFNAWGVVFNGSMTESNDYFEPRVWGEISYDPYGQIAEHGFHQITKGIAVDAGIGYVFVERDNWWEWNYDAEVRFRISDRLFSYT